MKHKIITLYSNGPCEELILDGAKEQEEALIIEKINRITGVPEACLEGIVNECKEKLKDTYMQDQLEDFVLQAAEKIRRKTRYETIRG